MVNSALRPSCCRQTTVMKQEAGADVLTAWITKVLQYHYQVYGSETEDESGVHVNMFSEKKHYASLTIAPPWVFSLFLCVMKVYGLSINKIRNRFGLFAVSV